MTTNQKADEAFDIIIKGSVGVDNPFHPGDVVYFGSIQNMTATVTSMPKIGDVIEATGGVPVRTESRVKVREILNDMPPHPAHLQAARDAWHVARYSGFFNDRAEPSQERKNELDDMRDDEIYMVFDVAMLEEIEAAHAEALDIDEAINIAVRVIKAMPGHDIEAVLAGVRSGLYRNGVINNVYAAGYTALRIAVEESHAEALEINAIRDFRQSPAVVMQTNFWAANDHSARRDLVEQAHKEALKENLRFDKLEGDWWYFRRCLDSDQQAMMIARDHAEALKLNQIIITRDDTKTTNFGGMTATDGTYSYSYDRCLSSVTRWNKDYTKAVGAISHKKLKWCGLSQGELINIIAQFDSLLENAAEGWGDIRGHKH